MDAGNSIRVVDTTPFAELGHAGSLVSPSRRRGPQDGGSRSHLPAGYAGPLQHCAEERGYTAVPAVVPYETSLAGTSGVGLEPGI